MSPIQFPGNAEWGAVSQVEARRLASDENIRPFALRVFFAALGESNRIGHACFATGGLAKLLFRADRETGEVIEPSAQGVNRAIRSAKQMGLIKAESCARCLILPRHLWIKEGKGNAACSLHGEGIEGAEWAGP